MTATDYHFELPPELVAQEPPARRGDSRLLLVAPGRGPVGERAFADLPALLRAGDLLVLNESRVLPARLFTRRTDTGGKVELLLVGPTASPRTWQALARPARRLRPGLLLALVTGDGAAAATLTVAGRDGDGDGLVTVTGDEDPGELARRHGVMPLPPYIRRAPRDPRAEADRERYQTVFAAAGAAATRSVAAPTAGLHFTAATLAALAAAGVATARVQLHVGPGTFQPPSADQVAARRLHPEVFRLPAATAAAVAATRAGGGRIVAVGTTSLRVLETAARLGLPAAGGPDRRAWPAPGEDEPVFTGSAERRGGHWEVAGTTRLFVAPPDRVTGADGLLTNFHLPGSSLLMLVAAVAGDPAWRRAYAHAVAARLRFYSYGDCMLILPGLEEAAP
ncbi:MAG: S-adenosylmethionine:tRNA ribosyltransferase-isomerase [Candidatus Krumholzibacteriia bacterium]